MVVHNYARDSSETSRCEATLLATLYKDAEQTDGKDDPADYPHRAAIFDWLHIRFGSELKTLLARFVERW